MSLFRNLEVRLESFVLWQKLRDVSGELVHQKPSLGERSLSNDSVHKEKSLNQIE